MGFFDKLKQGLAKTRNQIAERTMDVISIFKKVDDALFEELEEVLIMSDVGYETSSEIIERLRQKTREEKITESADIQAALQEIIGDILTEDAEEFVIKTSPAVILVIGVNGVGKTTSIGKMAAMFKDEGKRVILGAADTFRAAAIDQLAVWCERSGADIVKQNEGSDPAAVVYDAIQYAKKRKADVLIVDTAGRLHNKKNLMAELGKISRVIRKASENASVETLLVLEAITGQNAIFQAKEFISAAEATGIILTKLDGTAKGGSVISIKKKLGVPVRFVGVGEGVDDLLLFDAKNFAETLFSLEDGE